MAGVPAAESREPRGRALVVCGGWEGHAPAEVGQLFSAALLAHGFDVEQSASLESLADLTRHPDTQLVALQWTDGSIARAQLQPLLNAVAAGTGLAGVHGGLGDTFRHEPEYQFMVGGQFVAHPGGDGVTYAVHIVDTEHPITHGVADFEVTTEQYYLHIDPAIHVLATTRFGATVMPVAWTTRYGAGRVFYCALGHTPAILRQSPVARLVKQGLLWAARG
jgi:hypothetical protein